MFKSTFKSPIQNAFPIEGADEDAATYAEVLRDTYSASEIWPLVDIASGTNIPAFINSDRDGTLTGWDLQNAAGPVAGTLAPYSDGANDYGNIYTSNGSTGLADIFDGDVGSVFIWVKATAWSGKYVLRFIPSVNGNELYIGDAGGTLYYVRRGGGTTTFAIKSAVSSTLWVSLGLSWSDSSDELRAYYNGLQTDSTKTGLGTFSGTLSNQGTIIGASSAIPASVFNGRISYYAMKFGSVWSDADFLGMHNAASTAGPD